MTREQIIYYIKDGKSYLTRNDFDGFFSNLYEAYRGEVYEFLIQEMGINPLKYMSRIPERLFTKVSSDIIIPENINRISSNAFNNYQGSKVVFSDDNNPKVSTIPNDCFTICPNLEYVYIPSSVLKIERNNFSEGINLEKLVVETPRRPEGKKLRLPQAEVDSYRKFLKFVDVQP